jgi:acyl carrier protein
MTMPNQDEIRAWLIQRLAKLASLAPERVDPAEEIRTYGVSSVRLTQMSGDLEDFTGARVDPAVFWDHPTIDALSAHLAEGGRPTA